MVEKLHLQTWFEASPLQEAWQAWSGFVAHLPGEVALEPKLHLVPGSDVDTAAFLQEHAFVGPMEPIGCHFLDDILHSGMLYPFKGGALVDDGSHLSMVSALWLEHHPPHYPGARSAIRRRVIESPVLAVAGPGHQTYGHWIIDFLPRLAIARAVLGERFRELKFLLLSDTPAWASTLLSHFFGITEADCIRFEADRDEFYCPRVCYPTYAHSYPFLLHSFLRQFYSAANQSRAACRRLCVIRRLPGPDPRPFARRAAFEDMAVQEGFELVDPHGLSIDEQAALFGEAAVVIGEYGSALHNSVFSPAGAVFGVLNAPGVEQTRLCAAFQQPIVYMPSSSTTGAWSLSEPQLRSFFRTVHAVAADGGHAPRQSALRKPHASGGPAPGADIDHYRAAGRDSGVDFTQLASAARMLPPSPAFMLGPIPEAATHEMFSSHIARPAGYYTVRDARVTQDGIVIQNNTPLTSLATNHPDFHCEQILRGLDPALWSRPPLYVEGQGIILIGPGWPSWGHWLVDFLPRLYLMTLAGLDVCRVRWIVPTKIPRFARDLLANLGIPDTALLEFDPDQEVLHLDEVLMPTNLQAGALMHPRFIDSLRWLRARLPQSRRHHGRIGPKIFISRSKGDPNRRFLLNRARMQEIAASFGYTIVYPEEMTALQQIAAFEGATHICGEYGSGLHTSIFSRSGTVVTCLRGTLHTAGVLQNGLARACDHPIGYIFGESVPHDPRQAYEIAEKTFVLGMECAERASRIGAFEILE
jgi:capsular polysaccharide biosynthesis protein